MSADGDAAQLARLAELIAAVGTDMFPERFLAALAALSGSQLCSAFSFDETGVPRVLLAEGSHPAIPAFAQVASLNYAREYWKHDLIGRRMRGGGRSDRIKVARVSAAGIADSRHRRDCYERAGIGERLSLCAPGEPAILANGYRMRTGGAYSLEDIERVERYAAILIAAIRRHAQLAAGEKATDTVRMLISLERGLSGREVEVAAALVHGRTQIEIGEEMGLSLSTVVTYRRRAYQKLGVGNRRQLMRLVGACQGAC